MTKQYIGTAIHVAPTPRNKRNVASSGSGTSTTIIGSGGTTTIIEGSNHDHSNLSTLERISADSEGYMKLATLVEAAEEGTEAEQVKVKAGYADEAGHAADASHADEASHAATTMTLDDDSPVKNWFLSKIADDLCQGKITFAQLVKALDGLNVGSFTEGVSGARIDAAGNAEVETLKVRSFMKVYELIYNRLNSLEGETSFADTGIIDSIPASGQVRIRQRWDGDTTAFKVGDIVYSYVNDLEGGMSGKAWAVVQAVDTTTNTLTLTRYADAAVPGGVNAPFAVGMVLARWGNTFDGDRQRSFYISCDEGRLAQLMGVATPKLDKRNYGVIVGLLPEGLVEGAPINYQQPYLYARGAVIQDLIRVDWQGAVVREQHYRGLWTASQRYVSTQTEYDTVTYDGVLWQALSDNQGQQPRLGSPYWLAMTSEGEQGIWQLVPSVGSISINGDTGRCTPTTITAAVQHTDRFGTQAYDNNEALAEAGVSLWWNQGNGWQRVSIGVSGYILMESGGGAIQAEDGGMPLSYEVSNDIYFRNEDALSGTEGAFELRDAEGNVLATVSVPYVRSGATGKDGEDGKDGAKGDTGLLVYPAGVYDANTEYRADNGASPVVMQGNSYYRLSEGAVWKKASEAEAGRAATPEADVANNGGYWVAVEQFNTIFADVVMAPFGKLGSAVFSGDWMISQRGTLTGWRGMGNYEEITTEASDGDYSHFKGFDLGLDPNIEADREQYPYFTPKFAINYKTGEMRTPRMKVVGGMQYFYGSDPKQPNIVIGVDECGQAVLQFYDNDGNLVRDFGVQGMRDYTDSETEKWVDAWLHALGTSLEQGATTNELEGAYGGMYKSVPYSTANHKYKYVKAGDVDNNKTYNTQGKSSALNGWYCKASQNSAAYEGEVRRMEVGSGGGDTLQRQTYLYYYSDGVLKRTVIMTWTPTN